MSDLAFAAGKAFLISLVLTPMFRDVFRAYNVVDRPGRRKVHAYPIPRVGGLPIAIGYVIALLALSSPDKAMPGNWTRMVLPGAAVVFFMGLIDDFFNLRPIVKLLAEIVAALIVFAGGLRVESFGDIPVPYWLSLPITVFWLILTTNAQNLIDGLDGLCTGMAFFATVTFICAGVIHHNPALVYVAVPLSGSLLGFLLYNFNPATVFLGDSGALTVGFLLGCLGLIWTEVPTGLPGLFVPLLAVAVPLTDLSLSIVRRSLRGQPIFSADRGHIHHKLLDRGLSVRNSALSLYAIASTAAGFAVLLSYPVARGFHGFVLLGCGVAGWAGIRELRYPEFKVAGMLLFRNEFRSAFSQKLRMEQLSMALAAAKHDDDWWKTLVEAGRENRWIRLCWLGNHPPRETAFLTAKLCWSFQIELNSEESIRIEGDAAGPGPLFDLVSFSEILTRTLPGKRGVEQPALL